MKCPKCGLGYEPDYPDNVKAHRRYHDRIVNGVYARKIKSDKIIHDENECRITVVNYLSPIAQKVRAEKTGIVALRDTPFDFAPYHSCEQLDERNVHIFLYNKKNRIVGFLLVERKKHVLKLTWEEYRKAGGKEIPEAEPIWSIGLVWVHKKCRQLGLGTQLVKASSNYLDIELKTIGWYIPFTDEGEKLAKSLCPESFIIGM